MLHLPMNTPVALIIFNRPDKTKKVLEVIRQVKPSKLLVVADGPRQDHPSDVGRCKETRAVIDSVDWNCEVLTNYSDINLGCGKRPATGITWVFDQVQEAIILEDDCVPHPTFFSFCEELLQKYRFDKRIMHISGINPCYRNHSSKYSYSFSSYALSWGWATWKRAWNFYDFSIREWSESRNSDFLQDILPDRRAINSWNHTLQSVYDNKIDAWDYQWTFTCWWQNGLSIIPETNLVNNIGFGEDATHTFENFSGLDLSTDAINFPLKHPNCMMRDRQLDYLIEKTLYNYHPCLTERIITKFKKISGISTNPRYMASLKP
jgi:hypothetical protein